MKILYSIALLLALGLLLLGTSSASANGGDVIEGRVYEKDWAYQAPDSPLPGVEVHLQSLDQGPEPVTVAATATDAQGHYSFDMNQHPPGDYQVLLPSLATAPGPEYISHVVIVNDEPKPTKPAESPKKQL